MWSQKNRTLKYNHHKNEEKKIPLICLSYANFITAYFVLQKNPNL